MDGHTDKTDHDHMHGTLDSAILTSQRGLWALKWSLGGLLVTAFFQLGIVLISDSVALLADTIHNFSDAALSIPLWIAFRMSVACSFRCACQTLGNRAGNPTTHSPAIADWFEDVGSRRLGWPAHS